MKKIGIAIKPTVSGNYHPIVINNGDWALKIRDPRPALLRVPSMVTDHSLISIFLIFDKDGCYVVLARTITDNDLENISAWAYIPSDVVISEHEVDYIMGHLWNIVSKSELPSQETLEKLFAHKQYPVVKKRITYKPSPRNNVFAKRRLYEEDLSKLISQYRYQDYYDRYEAIFLETTDTETVNAEDISLMPLAEMPALEKPEIPKAEPKKETKSHSENTQLITATPPQKPPKVEKRKIIRKKIVTQPFGVPEKENILKKPSIRLAACVVIGIIIGVLILWLKNFNESNAFKYADIPADNAMTSDLASIEPISKEASYDEDAVLDYDDNSEATNAVPDKNGYITTASGLKYKVIKKGTGRIPNSSSVVIVDYEGKLASDGTVFDSSYQRGEAIELPLDRVIPGWTEGLQLMKEGATYEFYIPYNLAYGENGTGPIPPKADLIFKVELHQVK